MANNTSLEQAVLRLQENEARLAKFVNDGAEGGYITTGGDPVPSIQKFLAAKGEQINVGAASVLAQATARADSAEAAAVSAAASAVASADSSLSAAASAASAASAAIDDFAQEGPWTPVDGSGAGLSLISATGWWFRNGDLITLLFQVTYPSNGDPFSAAIGGFPFQIRNSTFARAGGTLTISTSAAAKRLYPLQGGTNAPVLNDLSAAVPNAALSEAILAGIITYPAA